MDNKYRVLIIYDISDDRQRRNYVKILNRFGRRVQYSAFEAILSEKPYKKLLNMIGRIYDKDDSIRIYRMCMDTDVSCFGKDDGIIMDYNDDIVLWFCADAHKMVLYKGFFMLYNEKVHRK